MASNIFRTSKSNQLSSNTDETIKTMKENIRESRLIQAEQWESSEFQEKFINVRHVTCLIQTHESIDFRVQSISLKCLASFNTWEFESNNAI